MKKLTWARARSICDRLQGFSRDVAANRRSAGAERATVGLDPLEPRLLLSATGPEFPLVPPGVSYGASAVAATADNGFVVVYEQFEAQSNDRDLFMRRFDAEGRQLGVAIRVNHFVAGDQSTADVAVDGAGNIVVVWQSLGTGRDTDIYLRRFDPQGQAIDDQEMLIHDDTAGWQWDARVAVNGPGQVAVAWTDATQGHVNIVVSDSLINLDLMHLTTVVSASADVALNHSGELVVAWLASGSEESAVRTRRFAYAQGWEGRAAVDVVAGDPYQVHFDQVRVAINSAGDAAVLWHTFHLGGVGDYIGTAVLNAQQEPRYSPIMLTAEEGASIHSGFVEVDDAGVLTVAWVHETHGVGQISLSSMQDTRDVYYQQFDVAGEPVAPAQPVSIATEGGQYEPRLSVNGNGRLVAVWTSVTGEGPAIMGRTFQRDGDDEGPGNPGDQDPDLPDSAGNTLATAFDLGALFGRDVITNTVSEKDPVDYFRFELTRKAKFTAELQRLDKGARFVLRNAKGKVIKRGKIRKNGVPKLGRKLKAGVYYIQVSYNKKAAATAVSSDLVLTVDVAGNKKKGAMKLGDLQPLSLIDYIGKDDTRDLIRFKVTQTSRIVLSLGDEEGNTRLTLLDGKGKLMRRASYGSTGQVIDLVLKEGVYFISVAQDPDATTGGNFLLSINDGVHS